MAALEALALDTATPQIRAPGAGDSYTFPRVVAITEAVGSSALTLTGATQTASNPLINATQTWNNAATTFTGWKFNVTDTASNAASLLLDLQVGGASKFNVIKGGRVRVPACASAGGSVAGTEIAFGTGSNNGLYVAADWAGFQIGNGNIHVFTSNSFILGSTAILSWSSNAFPGYSALSPDLSLFRDAANTLAQRNGTNAQTTRIYNTFTDASNYERLSATWSSNVAYLKPENAGTGSARIFVPVTGSTTVAGLPAASTAGAGARAFVTDANATTFLSTVAGGGANKVPVVSDGTNWLIG